jgi:hypothetical protein
MITGGHTRLTTEKAKSPRLAGESRTANADLYNHYSKPKTKSQVATRKGVGK